MIQVYNPDNTDYEKNGDMTLFPISAVVHPILNGSWSAELEHPIDEEGRWKYLQEEAVVKMPSFNGEQLFRIRNKEKADSGIICELEPIFFDSIGDCFLEDIRPTRKNGQEALNLMTAPNTKYSGQSNITKAATAYYQFKNLMQAINGEEDNSFINRWGGEILFDNFKIIINERVGGDYGVELRYGKNITQDGLTEEIDTRSIVTRIYPKAYNGYTMTDNGHVDSPLINSYPTVKSATITFSDVKMAADEQEDDVENGVIICNNQTELDAALRQRCEEQYAAGLDKPKVTITADMVLLQDTDLYKDYQVLETVSLGDTVHCRHSRLGIVTDARVIELEYDSVLRKVTTVVLGDFQYNYFSNVSSAVNRIDQAIRPDGTVMAEKIAGFINGAMTSLRAQYNVAKKQDVLAILFENLEEDNPLYGALAIGTQGILISKQRTADGRDWEWTTALTAGGLIANIIVAGILSDKLGRNRWNLDTGEFALSAEGFTIDGKDAETYFKENWTQEEIFNKLTNNGETQGIYMKDGLLYLNASWMNSGAFTVKKDGKTIFRADCDAGTVEIHPDLFTLSGKTVEEIAKDCTLEQIAALPDASGNLVKGYRFSSLEEIEQYWDTAGLIDREQADPAGGTDAIRINPTTTDNFVSAKRTTNQVIHNAGHYTFSVWLKAFEERTIKISFNRVTYDCALTTEWKKYTFSVNVDSVEPNWQLFTIGGFGSITYGSGYVYAYHPEVVFGYSSEEVFNMLTDNGAIQGIYMVDGKIYINGEYIRSLLIKAENIIAGAVTADKMDVTELAAIGATIAGLTLTNNTISGSTEEGNGGSMTLTSSGGKNFLKFIDNVFGSTTYGIDGITGRSSNCLRLLPKVDLSSETVGDGSHHSLGATKFYGGLDVQGPLVVSSGYTKSVARDTADYGTQHFYCYEMPTPILGDIGGGQIGEDGVCIVSVDDIFQESTNTGIEYHIFLQKEGQGELWADSKEPAFFTVKGTPGLRFAWEVKAKQGGMEFIRFRDGSMSNDWGFAEPDYESILENDREELIKEMEALQ